MTFTRTYKTERLYHQFLKPKGISIDKLPFLVARLYSQGFIELFRSSVEPDYERYAETEKLTSRQHRDELFKLIQELL